MNDKYKPLSAREERFLDAQEAAEEAALEEAAQAIRSSKSGRERVVYQVLGLDYDEAEARTYTMPDDRMMQAIAAIWGELDARPVDALTSAQVALCAVLEPPLYYLAKQDVEAAERAEYQRGLELIRRYDAALGGGA